ncbi:lipoyl(octanoyl) transferase LipB [Arthrobacter sp. APC 3897]|uniref:lipoyl(octanoyl) transferase LipB n=1 Tax=Arthrobacter sp. APC 3897 TaxID=3035204 RepID=UPI0025B4F040|nr:lipoyl(octanoyl) transferase LipB [Arthrobacter sp. APC 3897]MDN3483130.1 lipoyl(octanoyl) transferase LipB [Arthrobacter sp. APC 3897]
MALEFLRIGLAPDYVDYLEGWDRQRSLHERVRAGSAPDTVLLLEHSPVYTAGKRTEDHERPFDGTPVIPVDRGGKLTWHGPGQLVGYPILRLPDPSRVADYVATLEDAIIAVLADYGVTGERVAGRSGVWVRGGGPDRKIAAIGIRVDHGVTMHGFSLNCSNDLAPYAQIVACGITDAGTTSLSAETGRLVTPADLVARVEDELRRRSDRLVREHPVRATDTISPEPAAAAPGRSKGSLL